MSRHADWPARLRIAADAFIAPGATVVGEVTLGARSSVWFGSVLRGDSAAITIGDDSNIQDLTTVHVDEGQPAIVGQRVTVGHRAIVHGCVIEDDCLIGMGVVILSGARIGAGSLIGAAALVTENAVIPPGSLALGAPARVVGPVREAHRAAIRTGAEHYVELSRSYLRRGMGSALPPTSWRRHLVPLGSRPMDHLEWEQRVQALREGPALAGDSFAQHGDAAFRRRPGEGRWSALEVVCHLRDCDREVFVERLERTLTEEFPAIADVPAQDWAEARRYRDADAAQALAEWAAVRATLVRRLEPLPADAWVRPLVHPHRGPHTLADVVRYWSDHDLSHRRQWREALGAFA